MKNNENANVTFNALMKNSRELRKTIFGNETAEVSFEGLHDSTVYAISVTANADGQWAESSTLHVSTLPLGE